MVCVNCSYQKTSVINSRTQKTNPQVWRRRRCMKCQCTFTTYERVSSNDELVVQSSKDESPFDPGILIQDIALCFGHAPEKASKAYWLAQTVENSLLLSKQLVISSAHIVKTTHSIVKAFDPLAGEQYAVRHYKALE